MFDFDAGKLIVIGIVALIVIGPKELPRVLRQVGNAVGKMRRMAAEFQGQFMDAMREADLEDVKKEMAAVAESAKLDVAFDPVADMREQVSGAISDAGKDIADYSTIVAEPVPSLPQPVAIAADPVDEYGPVIATGIAPVAPEAVAPSIEAPRSLSQPS